MTKEEREAKVTSQDPPHPLPKMACITPERHQVGLFPSTGDIEQNKAFLMIILGIFVLVA